MKKSTITCKQTLPFHKIRCFKPLTLHPTASSTWGFEKLQEHCSVGNSLKARTNNKDSYSLNPSWLFLFSTSYIPSSIVALWSEVMICKMFLVIILDTSGQKIELCPRSGQKQMIPEFLNWLYTKFQFQTQCGRNN